MGELVFLGNLELVLVEFTGPVEDSDTGVECLFEE